MNNLTGKDNSLEELIAENQPRVVLTKSNGINLFYIRDYSVFS